MIGQFIFIGLAGYILWLFAHTKKQMPNERNNNDNAN